MGWSGTGWSRKKLQRTLLLLTGSKGRLRVRAILGCFGAVSSRENFEIIMNSIGLFIMLAQTFSIFIFNDFFCFCLSPFLRFSFLYRDEIFLFHYDQRRAVMNSVGLFIMLGQRCFWFLGAKKHLYKRLCWSVRWSVGRSVCPHISSKTGYVAIVSRRGGGRGKLVTSLFLRA